MIRTVKLEKRRDILYCELCGDEMSLSSVLWNSSQGSSYEHICECGNSSIDNEKYPREYTVEVSEESK